ncbi:MAG: hypothetical protein ACFFCX_14490 [Candidatus Sifarchaeia archaeon]
MNKYRITIPTNPDDYSSGHSVKRALALLIASILICTVASELVKLAAITVSFPILVFIHALAATVMLSIYRWFQLRAQEAM